MRVAVAERVNYASSVTVVGGSCDEKKCCELSAQSSYMFVCAGTFSRSHFSLLIFVPF